MHQYWIEQFFSWFDIAKRNLQNLGLSNAQFFKLIYWKTSQNYVQWTYEQMLVPHKLQRSRFTNNYLLLKFFATFCYRILFFSFRKKLFQVIKKWQWSVRKSCFCCQSVCCLLHFLSKVWLFKIWVTQNFAVSFSKKSHVAAIGLWDESRKSI